MAIDKDTVRYVAHLARIRLDDEELDLLVSQLEDIVNFKPWNRPGGEV